MPSSCRTFSNIQLPFLKGSGRTKTRTGAALAGDAIVGIPKSAYHPDGTERPPYPNQVFLVFVNDEQVAYNWRWERAAPDDRKLPQDHEARFKKRLL